MRIQRSTKLWIWSVFREVTEFPLTQQHEAFTDSAVSGFHKTWKCWSQFSWNKDSETGMHATESVNLLRASNRFIAIFGSWMKCVYCEKGKLMKKTIWHILRVDYKMLLYTFKALHDYIYDIFVRFKQNISQEDNWIQVVSACLLFQKMPDLFVCSSNVIKC